MPIKFEPHLKKILNIASGVYSPPVTKNVSQMSLELGRKKETDRNFEKGGRSFYFFDFDDNVAFLSTHIYLFHKETKEEVPVSSGQFAQINHIVGQAGEYQEYCIDFDHARGSFRNFRDVDLNLLEKAMGKKQMFVQDILEALSLQDFQWKGPSWDCFYHAVFNRRPLAVITARGHNPETIKSGIGAMIQRGHLPNVPNYLSVFPVSHLETRKSLGDYALRKSVAELKKRAIRASVEQAFETYGYNTYHRFGMSDDDPHNVQLITEAMQELKRDFHENSFFVFDSSGRELVKREILVNDVQSENVDRSRQMTLFDSFDKE